MTFIEALKSGALDEIRRFPKADLHNHFVLGGNREYLFSKAGYEMKPISKPLKSMDEMDAWSAKYIGNRFSSPEGRKLLMEATFAQAKYDGVGTNKLFRELLRNMEIIVPKLPKIS